MRVAVAPLPIAITAAPAAASAPTVERVIAPAPAWLIVRFPKATPVPVAPLIATAPAPLTISKARF